MPDDLKAKISDSADANGRSLHAELLVRLNESFRINKNDADAASFEMRVSEQRLAANLVRQHAYHLGDCVLLLLQMLHSPDPKRALNEYRDVAEIAKEAAEATRKYATDLNPRIRLREYEQAVEQAEELLKEWRPDMLPWAGEDDLEKARPRYLPAEPLEVKGVSRISRQAPVARPVSKVVLVGNIGKTGPQYEQVVKDRTGTAPNRDGDTVPPGEDVGSKHRPARKPSLNLRGARKK